ncbi:MAG TPA: hypothetical protein VGE40_01545 [Bacilli bacterium]
MRIGGFLFGSLVGAAAVVYFSRNNKPTMASSWSQAGDSINNLVDTAKNKMMNMSTKMQQNKQNPSQNQTGMEKVEDIVNQDPRVKHQVNEILQDNNVSKPQITQ